MPPQKFIPTLRTFIRTRQLSYATEKSYVNWVVRFIKFHKMKHPKEMKEERISQFLTYLANSRNVSASTQNQALNALVFLYREFLKIELGDFSKFARADKPKLLPVVLSRDEVKRILLNLEGTPLLMTGLLYGCGLRLKECLRLRVKDIDLERSQLWVRQSKGKKDRMVPLSERFIPILQAHLAKVKLLHEKDLKEGFGQVYLPFALDKKYPKAPYEWAWQYIFPAKHRSKDPRSNIVRRHHLYDSVLIRHIKRAALKAKVAKKLTSHSFRHSYATHLLEDGFDIRTVQQYLGHEDLKTTMIYTHVTQKNRAPILNPIEEIFVASSKKETDAAAIAPIVGAIKTTSANKQPFLWFHSFKLRVLQILSPFFALTQRWRCITQSFAALATFHS